MAAGYMPRTAGEGQVGSTERPWAAVVANNLVTKLGDQLVDVATTFATAASVAELTLSANGDANTLRTDLTDLSTAVASLTTVVAGKQDVDARLTGFVDASLTGGQLVVTGLDGDSFVGLSISEYIGTLLSTTDAVGARDVLGVPAVDHGRHVPADPLGDEQYVLTPAGWTTATQAALGVERLAGFITGDGCSPPSPGMGSLGTSMFPWDTVAANKLLIANADGNLMNIMDAIVSVDITNALSGRIDLLETSVTQLTTNVEGLDEEVDGLQPRSRTLDVLSATELDYWHFLLVEDDVTKVVVRPISVLGRDMLALTTSEAWRGYLDAAPTEHGNHVPDPPLDMQVGERYYLNAYNSFQKLDHTTVNAPTVTGEDATGVWSIDINGKATMAERDRTGALIDEEYTRNHGESRLGQTVSLTKVNRFGNSFTIPDVLSMSIDSDDDGNDCPSVEFTSSNAFYFTAGGSAELDEFYERYDELDYPQDDLHGFNVYGNSALFAVPGGYMQLDHDGYLNIPNGVRGPLLGTATEASRLANPRSIAVAGAVTTDPVIFDGSTNVVLHTRSCVADRVEAVIDEAQTVNALLVTADGSGDAARLRVGGSADALSMELATAGDGDEPIYVRQYMAGFGVANRVATLLDGSGNTVFPGTVNAALFHGSFDLLTAATTKMLLVGSNNGVLGVDPDVYLTTTGGQLRAATMSTGTLTADTKVAVKSTVADASGLRSNRVDVVDATPTVAFHFDGSSSATTTLTATSANLLTCSTEFTATKCHNAVWNDYAEFFEQGEPGVRPGDLVALDVEGDEERYVRATSASRVVIGVCSDEYGHVVGGLPAEPGKTVAETNDGRFVAVALAGRVWTNVRGRVDVGDHVVPSDEPGVGRAVKYVDPCFVGTALTAKVDEGLGRVRVLVNR